MQAMPLNGIGAPLGLLLSYMLPGENTWLRTVFLTAIFQIWSTMLENLPSVSKIARLFSPKPNAIFVDDSSVMFRHIESYIVNKYIEKIRACRLLPRNGEFTYSLSNIQFNDALFDTFQGEELQLRLLSPNGTYDNSGEPLKAQFFTLDRVQLGEDGTGGAVRSRRDEDDDGGSGSGRIIVISSWKHGVVRLRQYVNELCNFRSSAQVTVMYVPEVTGTLNEEGSGGGGRRRRGRRGGQGGNADANSILSWQAIHVKSNCRLSNTILSQKVETELLDDVKQFMASEDWYNAKGIPWKRGYVLSGPPGTGKTSTVKALAAEYNLPVFIIDFGIVSTNMQFQTLMRSINTCINAKPFILCFEDCERSSLFRNKREYYDNDEETISESFFLNELDGLVETHGRLLFLTVNDEKRLENIQQNALMRPGRIDRKIVIDYCDFDQVRRLMIHFYGLHEQIAALRSEDLNGKYSPATVVNLLQKHAHDPTPFKVIRKLFKNSNVYAIGGDVKEEEGHKNDDDDDKDDKTKLAIVSKRNRGSDDEDDSDGGFLKPCSEHVKFSSATKKIGNRLQRRYTCAKRDVKSLQNKIENRELKWKQMESELAKKSATLEKIKAKISKEKAKIRAAAQREREEKRIAAGGKPKGHLLSLPGGADTPLYVKVIRARGRPSKNVDGTKSVLQIAPLSASSSVSQPPEFVCLNGILYHPVDATLPENCARKESVSFVPLLPELIEDEEEEEEESEEEERKRPEEEEEEEDGSQNDEFGECSETDDEEDEENEEDDEEDKNKEEKEDDDDDTDQYVICDDEKDIQENTEHEKEREKNLEKLVEPSDLL